jgi:hypothetical protein
VRAWNRRGSSGSGRVRRSSQRERAWTRATTEGVPVRRAWWTASAEGRFWGQGGSAEGEGGEGLGGDAAASEIGGGFGGLDVEIQAFSKLLGEVVGPALQGFRGCGKGVPEGD